MSALLKATAGIAALPVAPPVADPRDEVIADLHREIASLRQAAEQAAVAGEARVAEAIEQADRQARAAMRRDDTARIALLERALTGARTAFDERLAQLERLAPALARAVLDRLFATSDRAEWVEAMIARRLGDFRREAIVAVAVSAEDFDDALPTCAGVTVRHDRDLTSGQCRIEAKVETLALDLQGDWAALAATLDALAEDGA
jgi:flagellar biosynthesis/type III secretory pathway protein FliH